MDEVALYNLRESRNLDMMDFLFIYFEEIPKLNIKEDVHPSNDKMSEKESVVLDSDDVETEKVERGEKIWIQKLITDDEGAGNCFMRKFTLKPGAYMPLHQHDDTDHVQYILEGKMKVKLGDKIEVAEKGDALYIPSGLLHSYENPYEEKIKFLCVVPAGEIHTEIKDK